MVESFTVVMVLNGYKRSAMKELIQTFNDNITFPCAEMKSSLLYL